MILFTYRVNGAGWAVATIANERSAMSVPASYLCDALGDFVDAVQSLFNGNFAECLWEEEPGIVRWEFRREGSRVIVKVGWDQTGGEQLVGEDDWLHFSEEVDPRARRVTHCVGLGEVLRGMGIPVSERRALQAETRHQTGARSA